MDATAQYREQGYAGLAGFVPVALCQALFDQFMGDLREGTVKPGMKDRHLLTRRALELHGSDYAPMRTFHWGLTPAVAALAGAELVPTHCYFRIYNAGDVCHAHNDREACEHSVSLMLASGGEAAWPLDIATGPSMLGERRWAEFADEPGDFASVPMRPGDAVLYQGITRRHGRRMPNPNPWSAHLFLHWVTQGGAYADEAFGAMASTLRRRAASARPA